MRQTQRPEEPVGNQKLATKTPRPRLNSNDRLKSTDFCKISLHRMSHGPAVCSRYTVFNGFGEGTGRTQSRRVRCEGGSQGNFALQVAELGSKMGCLAGRKCVFPNVKLMISCFHKKLTKQLLVSDPWHHKVASWAPEGQKCCVLYYLLDARGGRMEGFWTPWGCRGPMDPPGRFRFCKENECLLCFGDSLGSQVGVI